MNERMGQNRRRKLINQYKFKKQDEPLKFFARRLSFKTVIKTKESLKIVLVPFSNSPVYDLFCLQFSVVF